MVEAWLKVNFHEAESIDGLLTQRIWFNSHIKKNNQPFILCKLENKGVYEMNEILRNDGSIMSLAELNEKYVTDLSFMDYQSLVSAIPRSWKNMLKNLNITILEADFENTLLLDQISQMKKVSVYISKEIKKGSNVMQEITSKWSGVTDLQQVQLGLKPDQITDIIKYRSFQYKLMHKAIWLNNWLYHCNIVQTQDCTFCASAKEDYFHFFFDCQVSQGIWSKLHDLIAMNMIEHPFLEYSNIMINRVHKNSNNFMNLLCLIAKQHLYYSKIQNKQPNAKVIINEFY